MARIVPYNPIAFPPSMEVRCRWYDYTDVIGRVESGTETETTSGTCCRSASAADARIHKSGRVSAAESMDAESGLREWRGCRRRNRNSIKLVY